MINDSDYCVFYYDETYQPEMRKYSKRSIDYYQPKSGTPLAYTYAKQKKKIVNKCGLRHTFSNILFEMNENPKVIQQLLGHRDVKTTITVYNSVNNEYIRQTTEKFNEKVKEGQLILEQKKREEVLEERKEKFVKDMSDGEFDEMLQQLMEERKERKRKREKDFEM